MGDALTAVFWEDFHAAASLEQRGQCLLSKADFFSFLGDLPPSPDTCEVCHPGLHLLTQGQVAKIFDKTLAMQQACGPTASKGLTFSSLQRALYHVALLIGLHF